MPRVKETSLLIKHKILVLRTPWKLPRGAPTATRGSNTLSKKKMKVNTFKVQIIFSNKTIILKSSTNTGAKPLSKKKKVNTF